MERFTTEMMRSIEQLFVQKEYHKFGINLYLVQFTGEASF